MAAVQPARPPPTMRTSASKSLRGSDVPVRPRFLHALLVGIYLNDRPAARTRDHLRKGRRPVKYLAAGARQQRRCCRATWPLETGCSCYLTSQASLNQGVGVLPRCHSMFFRFGPVTEMKAAMVIPMTRASS